MRNPDTLQPTGAWHLTFPSPEAALAYRERLENLHGLSSTKLNSATNLWETTVPDHTRLGSEPAQLESLAETQTLLPGSLRRLNFKRKKAERGSLPWEEKLSDMGRKEGKREAGVLMEIYPPRITVEAVTRMVKLDGKERGLGWHESKPHEVRKAEQVKQPPAEEVVEESSKPASDSEDIATSEVAGNDGLGSRASASKAAAERRARNSAKPQVQNIGRFVFWFSTNAEAHRFHRYWNERTKHINGRKNAASRIKTSVLLA